ncbi:MAG: trypsin-like peptidase domain-containing protein [Planctomycetota bacterium]|nr:trypsin-like peptidase domain-containing protein [Planctomycetota bacterium]
MRRVVLVLLAAAATGGELSVNERELLRTVRHVSPSIVSVTVWAAASGRLSMGPARAFSGVVIDSAGTVLTSRLLLEGLPSRRGVNLRFPGEKKEIRAKVVHDDRASGALLLRPTGKPKRAPRVARPITTDAARPGTPVVLVGALIGSRGVGEPSASCGAITSIEKNGMMRASTRVNPGTVGAPLFDLKGGLVGIAVSEISGETVVLSYEKVRASIKNIPSPNPRRLGTGIADALTVVIEAAAARASASVVEVTMKRTRGSGVVVSADGYILCSARTIGRVGMVGGGDVTVRLGGRTTHDAEVRAWDARLRIALLKIDATGLKPLETAPAAARGSLAIAVAARNRITSGIIGRPGALRHLYPAFDALHTDAHVYALHAGGALVDSRGRLHGILLHIEDTAETSYKTVGGKARYGGASGLGFAVPMARITPLLERMKQGVSFGPVFLGVKTTPAPDGLLVTAIRGTSPSGETSAAEEADLMADDVLVELAGRKLRTRHDLQLALHDKATGDEVELVFLRGGETRRRTVSLTAR